MREIKFRAWDNNLEKWVNIGDEEEMLQFNWESDNPARFWFCHVDFSSTRMTVEQFTGLHDENGKEIYEGDVLEREEIYDFETGQKCIDRGTVVWQHAGWWVVFEGPNADEISLDEYVSTTGEVIGNIHENLELLEEK